MSEKYQDSNFILDFKAFLKDNIRALKNNIYIYTTSRKTTFPCVVLSYNNNIEIQEGIDSSRELNFQRVSLNIDVYYKDSENIDSNFEETLKLKDKIVNTIEYSKNYKNLIKTYDSNVPNIDETICRWRLTFEGVVSVKENYLV